MKLSRKLAAALALLALTAAPSAMAYDLLVPSGTIGTATAVSSLTDGKIYAIYDGNSSNNRNAFRYENENGAIKGTHATPETMNTLSAAYQWKAIYVSGNQWKFQNVRSGSFMKAAAHSTTMSTSAFEDQAGEFYVNPTSEGATTFSISSVGENDNNPHWDGNGESDYAMVGWGNNDNRTSGHPYSFYELSEENNNLEGAWAVKVVFPGGYTGIAYVRDGGSYTFPYSDIFTVDQAEVTNITGTVTITVTAIPEGTKEFRLVQARDNRWAKTDPIGVITMPTSNNGADAEVYYELPGDNGRSKFFSISQLSFLAQSENNANRTALVTNADNAGTFTVSKADTGAEVISSQNNISFNIRDKNVAGWNYVDVGSHWFMVYDLDGFNENKTLYDSNNAKNVYKQKLDEAKAYKAECEGKEGATEAEEYQAFVSAITTLENARFGASGVSIQNLLDNLAEKRAALMAIFPEPDVENYDIVRAQGQPLADLQLTDVSEWNKLITAVTTDEQKTNHQTFLLQKEIDNMFAAIKATANDKHIKIRNYYYDNGTRYMVPNGANFKTHPTDNEHQRVYTLKNAGKNGFNLYNEYTRNYLKSAASQSNALSSTSVQAEATVYTIRFAEEGNGTFYIAQDGKTGKDELLHNDSGHSVVNWEKAEATAWYLDVATDVEAAMDYYQGAKDYYNNLITNSGTPGDGFVDFHWKNIDKAAAAIEAAEAEGANVTTIRNSADILRTVKAVPNASGHFYRFKAQANNNYMTANLDGNQLAMSANANITETIFYYDEDGHLVALKDGLVISKFLGGEQNNWWKTVLASNTAKAGAITFATSGLESYYNIIASAGRYLYGNNSTVNCGGADGVGYRWQVTQVDWLPIPGSDGDFASICSPLSLQLKDQITANKVEVVNGKVELTPLNGSIIPANVPVVLHFTDKVERDRDNHLVYLKVNATGDDVIDSETGVYGSYLAVTKSENQKVFNGTAFAEPTTDYVPGFRAYIEEAGEALTANYPSWEQVLTPGKVFTIMNSDTDSDRGYILYHEGTDAVYTSNRIGAADTGNNAEGAAEEAQNNVNYHWMVISDNDGKYYLYNLGVQKFAAAYTEAEPIDAEQAKADYGEFAWHFSDYPTAVDIKFYGWSPAKDLADAIFTIHGGQNTTTNRPAGMMIINGRNHKPVVGVAGTQHDTDGCGWIFTEVAYETAPVTPTAEAIEAVKAEMVQNYEEVAAATASIDYEGISVDAGNHIGYYKNISQFVPAFTTVEEGADAEAKHYAVVRALNAMDNTDIHGFEHEKAYRFDADGEDVYYKASINPETGVVSVITGTLDVNGLFGKDDNAMYWLATENADGTLSFSHTFEIPKPKAGTGTEEPAAAPMRRAAAQEMVTVTCHLAENVTPRYDGFGKASLVNNDGTAVLKTTVYAPSGDAREMTTGIKEVELSASSLSHSDTVYDLQGRRVVKPGHGLYIVNGKKVRL